jgi:peptidoglycan DL-endopeptidase CwlO
VRILCCQVRGGRSQATTTASPTSTTPATPSPPPPTSSQPTAPPPTSRPALFAWNHSDGYVTDVLAWAARYAASGTQALTAEDSPVCEQAGLGPLPARTAGKVIAYAEAQLGKPYLWGGTGPDAFDCSGLTMMAYRAAGITIPRTSQQQWAYGRQIPASQAQPGDLVFFAGSDGTMTAPGHVGIVTGHDIMIDAPYTGQAVREESFSGSTGLVGFTRP